MTTRRIFVFGSNLSGIHGGGAARYAFDNHGAEWSVGEGPTGQCYAIPTKDRNIQSRSLEEVKKSVDRFISYAINHPELTFQVTRIGCGLAGFTDSVIASMFADSPDNCEFDSAWKQWIPTKKMWGTF